MKRFFYKYHGTGNDFIILDNRESWFDKTNIESIKTLCHRRFGIGADGVILLEDHPDFDFEMVYFNADGRLSSMCGNGGRCITAFAKEIGLIGTNAQFLAIDGVHESSIQNGLVKLQMNAVDKVKEVGTDYELDTGSPHYVTFLYDLKKIDTYRLGRTIRYNETYEEEGINVNSVQAINQNTLKVETYERGVEDLTYSCGTGVVACTIAYLSKTSAANGQYEIEVQTRGGVLKVGLKKESEQSYTEIQLMGPAKLVFKGEINL